MAGSPIEIPIRYALAFGSRYAALPDAPNAPAIYSENSRTKIIKKADRPTEKRRESEKIPCASLILPSPTSRVKKFLDPVAIIVPKSANATISGLMIPNAAMESMPRHLPIITPSITFPIIWVNSDKM